jgi:hypothetical protein
VSVTKRNIISRKRDWRLVGGSQELILMEEKEDLSRKMKEGECQREQLREYLGEPSRVDRQRETINMSTEDMERELAASAHRGESLNRAGTRAITPLILGRFY